MKKRSDLQRDIKRRLTLGGEFSEYMYACCDLPYFYMFGEELGSAWCWIDKIEDIPESEFFKKMPIIVDLLKRCGRAIDDHGFSFLAADFENFATDIDQNLNSELEAVEG